jgi:hypothetical protein
LLGDHLQSREGIGAFFREISKPNRKSQNLKGILKAGKEQVISFRKQYRIRNGPKQGNSGGQCTRQRIQLKENTPLSLSGVFN